MSSFILLFLSQHPSPSQLYTLSLHDALPISSLTILSSIHYLRQTGIHEGEFYALILFATVGMMLMAAANDLLVFFLGRSEEHTSELQSRVDLVCRLLLEKKKK